MAQYVQYNMVIVNLKFIQKEIQLKKFPRFRLGTKYVNNKIYRLQ